MGNRLVFLYVPLVRIKRVYAFFVKTNVLTYQLGNGLNNVFIPTQGYFMAALGILKIPWEKWVCWLLLLLLIWLALGMAAVIIAQALHLGPF